MTTALVGPAPLTRAPWPAAYKPLRPLSLTAQLAGLAFFEAAAYQAYSVHDSRFHYATHLLVGLIAAAAFNVAVLALASRPARGQILGIAGFHLLAMWPDLAFRLGVPHYRWMDPVSLFHISSHYMPGADTTWFGLAAAAGVAYTALLSAWLRARRTEAVAGLPPGLGIGGTAVWRPQRDPRQTVLAHLHSGPAADRPPLVLVHGLGATSAVWHAVAGDLAAAGRHSIRTDLMGYGGSLRIGTRFTVADQAAALIRLLATHTAPVHLVGHSWGCLVVARVALDEPAAVERVTLVSPAVFADARTAQRRFASRSWLARRTVAGAGVASAACGAMCALRPVLRSIAPRARADLPPDVAAGGVQHHYPAYRDGLLSLWQDNPIPELLTDPPVPVTVVLGDQDETVLPSDVEPLPRHRSVRLQHVPGTHLLPIQDPTRIAALLTAEPGQDGS